MGRKNKMNFNFTKISESNFQAAALEIFNFQYLNNLLYNQYCNLLKIEPENVFEINQIPFLPISFFKSHEIKTTEFNAELVFESSGTTGSINSKHFVRSAEIYYSSFIQSFKLFYGDPKQYCILGLLPSYLERGNSSLVYMVDNLIKLSGNTNSGFFLNDFESLRDILISNEKNENKTLLIGVTYALLDFFELNKFNLKHTIIMETGGMKGRRTELSRNEVHRRIKLATGVEKVHSEYGMTELLSQAYSNGNGIFHGPPWMKVLVRAEDDPFNVSEPGTKAKGIANIIDLANIYSCAFIQTDDTAEIESDGFFKITGRVANCDLRGCGLMVADI